MKVFVPHARDSMSRDGAAALAARIRDWWARRGVAVAPETERHVMGAVAVHVVRLPPVAGRPRGASVGGWERAA